MTIHDYIREAAGASATGSDKVGDVLAAAATRVGVSRATLYRWQRQGAVSRAADLIALAHAVNSSRKQEPRLTRKNLLTLQDLEKMAGVS